MIEQQRPHEVGAPHLEPLVAVGGGGEADIVQHRAEVEHLVVELDAVGGGERCCELVAPLAVGRDDRRALVEQPPHFGCERSGRRIDEIAVHASAHQSGGSVVTESNARAFRTVSAAAVPAPKTAVVSAEL